MKHFGKRKTTIVKKGLSILGDFSYQEGKFQTKSLGKGSPSVHCAAYRMILEPQPGASKLSNPTVDGSEIPNNHRLDV